MFSKIQQKVRLFTVSGNALGNELISMFSRSKNRSVLNLLSGQISNPVMAQGFFADNHPVPHQLLLEALGFPLDLVPEKYKCELMSSVMDEPVKLPATPQICEKNTILQVLRSKSENPFNRQPMELKDMISMPSLENEISIYITAIREDVINRCLIGSMFLSNEDYQGIHDRALKKAEDQAAAISVSPQRRLS